METSTAPSARQRRSSVEDDLPRWWYVFKNVADKYALLPSDVGNVHEYVRDQRDDRYRFPLIRSTQPWLELYRAECERLNFTPFRWWDH